MNLARCGPAYADPRSYRRFLLLVAVALPLDLYSKHWAFERFHQRAEPLDRMSVIPHLLEFRTVLNRGALFGVGKDQQWFFVVASIFACVFVAYLFATSNRRHRWTHVALALVLSGALGNLYDRATVKLDMIRLKTGGQYSGYVVPSTDDDYVIMKSYPRRESLPPIHRSQLVPTEEGALARETTAVRDFIHIRWTLGHREPWPWIFNLADVYLVIGVGLLVLRWLRDSWRARQRVATPVVEAVSSEQPSAVQTPDG